MQAAHDLRPLHRRALTASEPIVASVTSADLARPTPCDQWDLHELLAHMIGQNHGFAAAVEAGDAAPGAFASRPSDAASVDTAWHESAERIRAAFTEAPLDRTIRLVEISTDAHFSVGTAVGFHLLDTVVHTWDVASALGIRFRPDDELVEATWTAAQQVPDGPARERAGAAFAPRIASEPQDQWATALALLGRAVDWPR